MSMLQVARPRVHVVSSCRITPITFIVFLFLTVTTAMSVYLIVVYVHVYGNIMDFNNLSYIIALHS